VSGWVSEYVCVYMRGLTTTKVDTELRLWGLFLLVHLSVRRSGYRLEVGECIKGPVDSVYLLSRRTWGGGGGVERKCGYLSASRRSVI
jgi:hypothetical protein